MNSLPFNLSHSLQQTLQEFKEEKKIIEYLENHPSDLKDFINAFVKDLAWIKDQKNTSFNREIIRITLENPEVEAEVILKVLEVLENSVVFEELFYQELKSFPALFKRCLKILKTNEEWMKKHQVATHSIMKNLVQCQLDKNSSDLQKRVDELRSFIPSLSLCKVANDAELFKTAISRKNILSIKLLIDQGILENEQVKKSTYLEAAISAANFEIFKLLIDYGVKIEGDGSQEVQKAIFEYGLFEKYRESNYSGFNPSEIEDDINNIKKIAYWLVANGAKLPAEKKLSSSPFSSYGSYTRYGSNKQDEAEERLRRELLQIAHLQKEWTEKETISQLSNLDVFYQWASHYSDIEAWIDKRPFIASLIIEELATTKVSFEIQCKLLQMLDRKGLLKPDLYYAALQQAIDKDSIFLKALCTIRTPPCEPIAQLGNLTPLQYAVKKGSIESANTLFDFDSNPNFRLPPPSQVYFFSFIVSKLRLSKSEHTSSILSLLNKTLAHNVDLQNLPRNQLSQLWGELINWQNSDCEDLICRLLDHGLPFLFIADEKTQDSPLMMALKANKDKVAEKLMAIGAHTSLINMPNKEGKTPLSIALELNKENNLLQYLLDDGANISSIKDEWDLRRIEPLMLQKEKGEPKEVLKKLCTTKNLANLLSDSFMKEMKDEKGERLEGNNVSDSLDFVNSLLGTIIQEMATEPDMEQMLIKENESQREHFEILSKQLAKCAEFSHQIENIRVAPSYQKNQLLQAFTYRVVHQINGLKKGESLVLPSGWASEKGGHAMLCVIRCVDQGQYDCLSINTGDGTEHHAFQPQANKVFINPVCLYKGLTQAEVADLSFIQALFEPQINPEEKSSSYSPLDLYDGIFARFKDKLTLNDPKMDLYVTAQRAGSCSIRVLLAYMHVILGENAYKPLSYFLKKTALSAALSNEKDLKEQPILRHILRKGVESLCRNIFKLSKESLHGPSFEEMIGKITIGEMLELVGEEGRGVLKLPYSEEKHQLLVGKLEKRVQEKHPDWLGDSTSLLFIREAARGLATAYQVFDKIGEISTTSIGTKHANFAFPSVPPLKTALFSDTLSTLSRQVKKTEKRIKPEKLSSGQSSLSILTPIQIAELKGERLVSYIKQQENFCALQSQGASTSQEVAIKVATQTLLDLSLPRADKQDNWEELSLDQAQESLKYLSSLTQILLFSMQSSPVAFPERIIALYKAQAIAFRLACLIETATTPDKKIKLENFGIDFAPLLHLAKDIHNVTYDTPTKHKLKEVINYFKLVHSAKPSAYTLFNYTNWDKDAQIIQFPIPKESGEYLYLQEFYDQIKDWKKEDQEYYRTSYEFRAKISKEEWRLAKLWEGDKEGIPSYFLLQRNLSLFSYLMTNISSSSWKDYCNFSPNKNLVSLKFDNKTLKLTIASQGSWFMGEKTIPIGFHYPQQTNPSNSYASTHLPFINEEKIKCLSPQESQNAYTIKYQSELESLLSLTSQPLLAAHHVRMWLSSHLNDILDRDNQLFCDLALFCEERLLLAIKEEPSLVDHYLETIDKNLAELSFMKAESQRGRQELNEEDVLYQTKLSHAQLFFHQLRFRLLDHAQEAIKSNIELNISVEKEIQNTRNNLKLMLVSAPISNPKEAAIQRSARLILASSYLNFPPQNAQEIEDLIENLYYAQFFASLKDETDPSTAQAAKSALFSSLPFISLSLINLPEFEPLFNRILREIYGIPIDATLKWNGNFPIFKANFKESVYEINLLTCELKKDDVGLNQLKIVYEHENYQHAFGSKRFLSSSIVEQDENNICYEVFDEKGQPIHFFVTKQEQSFYLRQQENIDYLRIERQMDGINYLYIPWKDAPQYPDWPILTKQPNQQHYVLWQSLEDSHIKVIDRQSQEVAYIFTKEGKIQLPSGQIGEWIDIEKIPESKALIHFDTADHILTLQTEQNQEKELTIEFSRYQDALGNPIKFVKKIVEANVEDRSDLQSRLVWDRDPQYFISSKQELAALAHFDQFLILENHSGQRKALIPLKTFSTEQNKNFKGPPFNFEYELIDITGDGLDPKTPKQQIVSAYLSLLHGNYEEAIKYLERAYHLQRYKAEDLKYLGWIIHSEEENGDFDPNAIAVRNYASWLVHDNLFRNPESLSIHQEKIETTSVIQDLYQAAGEWENYLKGKGYWKQKPLMHEPFYKNSFSQKTSRLYESYLDIRKNVDANLRLDSSKKGTRQSRLTLHEEMTWLQNLLKIYPRGNLALRFAALTELEKVEAKAYAPFVQLKPPEVAMVAIQNSSDYSQSYGSFSSLGFQRAKTPNEAIALVSKIFPRTRPGKQFLDCFLDFYLIATKGTENQKKILLHLLYDMRHEPNPINQAYRALLEAIVLNHRLSPAMIKKIDDLKDKRTTSNSETYKELESLVKDYLQTSYASQNEANLFEQETSKRIKEISSYVPPLLAPPQTLPPEEDRLILTIEPQARQIALAKNTLGKNSYKKVALRKEHPSFPSYQPKTSYGQERYKKLLEDYQEGCKKIDNAVSFVFDREIDFRQWKADLEKQELEETAAPLIMLENLLKLANKAPPIQEQPSAYLSQRLKEMGKKRATISFTDLFAAFAQQSKAGYQKLNSNLTEKEIEEIHNTIGLFIINCLDRRQNQSKIKVLDKVIKQIETKEDDSVIQDSMQELGELMDQDLTEEVLTSPPLLVFNYLMNKHVRPDQIQDIQTMLGVSSLREVRLKFPNIFTQKIMGGGKTSVLGTLMALLKADGYHLSILVPPPSLYETNSQDMKIRSESLFGQKTSTVTYKRDSAYFNIAYLTNTYQNLIQAIEQRNSVILSSESLEAMENDYWDKREELSVLYQKKAELVGTENLDELEHINQQIQSIINPLKVLKETLKLIKTRGVFTFDEVDVTLGSRRELNFPIGDPISIPRQANELLADLFLLAATDPNILQEGLHLRENKQSELQPVQYEKIKKIISKELLIQLLISDKWSKRLFLNADILKKYQRDLEFIKSEEKPLEHALKDIIKRGEGVLKEDDLNDIYMQYGPEPSIDDLKQFFLNSSLSVSQLEDKLLVIKEYGSIRFFIEIYAFITNIDAPTPAYLYNLYDSKDPMKMQAADLFTLLRQELTEWLEESWKRSAGEHYGLSRIQSKKSIAIPYLANNKPSENSEFADPWETANRTLQLYLSDGLKFDQTIELIEGLQKKVRFEWSQAGYPPQPDEMPTAQAFFKATGLELLAINRGKTQQIQQVQQALLKGDKTALSLMLSYVVDQVLPTIKIYPEQITHNAQNLASMPKAKQGYAGTMESADTFPDDVKVNLDKGTNGKVLEVLLRSNKTVHVVENGDVQDHLKQILGWPVLKHPHAAQFRALIDLGPIYKGCSSEKIAREILTFMQSHPDKMMHEVKGVLYWDDASNMLCCIKLGEAKPLVIPSAVDSDTIFSITGLSNKQLFAFYPHHKLTGAELVLPVDAYALSTFSNTTPLRDLLQGNMRMRGIFKEQHIETVILRSTLSLVGNAIGKPDLSQQINEVTPKHEILSLSDLIPFAEFNESERQRADFPRSVLQKIGNHVKEIVLQELYKIEQDEEENRLFEKARHLAIRKHNLALFENFAKSRAKEIPSEQFLLKKADECLLPLTGYSLREIISLQGDLLPDSKHLPPAFITAYQRVNQTIQMALTKLPPTMSHLGSLEWGREATVEQLEETSTQQHQEQQTDYHIELDTFQQLQSALVPAEERSWKEDDFHVLATQGPAFTSYPLQHPSLPSIWPLHEVLEGHSILKKYASCFGEGLNVSENFIRTVDHATNLFDRHQKPVYDILAIFNPHSNQWNLVLVSLEEAVFFKKQLAEKKNMAFPMWLLEPEGFAIQSGENDLKKLSMPSFNQLQKSLIPVLFFMGNIQKLSANPWFDHFKEWAKENKNLKRDLLEAVILDDEGSEQRQSYQGSRIEMTLNELSYETFEISSQQSLLPKNLELGILATDNGRVTTALNLIEKISDQLDFNNVEHLNALVTLTSQAIKQSSKLAEKRQARDLLIKCLKQISNSIKIEKAFSFTDKLTLLEGINDVTINQLICDIVLILIKEDQIELASKIALSQIPSFKDIYPRDKLFNNPLFINQIKTLRTSTLKILQVLGEKQPSSPAQAKALQAIGLKFIASRVYEEKGLIEDLLIEHLNQNLTNLRGLEKIAIQILESRQRAIRNQIEQIYMNKNEKDLAPIVASIEESFLKYHQLMPALANMGIELLQAISQISIDYNSKLPKPFCIPIAQAFYASQNPVAMKMAKDLLRQFKKTQDWKACSEKQMKIVYRILQDKG